MDYREVSKRRRLLQCISSAAWCIFAGGPIFGFSALKPILIAENVYENYCDVDSNLKLSSIYQYTINPDSFSGLTSSISSLASSNAAQKIAKCTEQDLKLNMMFTVAAVLTNVAAIVIGRILDVYGPRVCGLMGASFLFLSCFVFIYSKEIMDSSLSGIIDPYLFGYSFLALGGPFTYISSFHLSNAFPEMSGTVLAVLIGAFDASSALFLIYQIFYNKTNGAFSFSSFFQLFLVVPIFITFCQVFVMPKDSYKTPAETTLCESDIPTEAQREVTETDLLLPRDSLPPAARRRDSLGDAFRQTYAHEDEQSLVEQTGGVFGILHGYTVKKQISTPWFYLMCTFAAVQMLKLNYFVATVNSQYLYLFHSEAQAEFVTKIFNIALPLGGIISVPFVGSFVDNVHTVTILSALVGISLILGICGLFGITGFALINVGLFVVYRPFFYTSVSDYCAKVFGFDTFGTVYGLIISISGLFNFLQSTLDRLTHSTFKMNPVPVNIFLICTTTILGLIQIVYVTLKSNLYKSKIIQNDSILNQN